MIDAIAAAAAASGYDFRHTAAPADPLRHLFDEWIPYYRQKRAVAEVLSPRSILEIGVRFGYSALAFLDGAPGAHYFGIDNDSSRFGGEIGALAWARQQLAGRNARLLVADTQAMTTLPDGPYDLVHVDGQQDGDGTYHDLELALAAGRWILLDGFLWTRQNAAAGAQFLHKYRSLIRGAFVLPGYAGDLLVQVAGAAHDTMVLRGGEDHVALRNLYDESYFLADCGGHDAFKRFRGRELRDFRLKAAFELLEPRAGMRIVDLGCGRGELAFHLAEFGAEVVGVDYSQHAIAIARSTFADVPGLRFENADAMHWQPERPVDAVVMTDVVEHISAGELPKLFRCIRQWLVPDGQLIVHTWPNRLHLNRLQRSRWRAAREAGAFLPRNQRSLFEDLMHINEQSPAELRRALRQQFAHAVAWPASATDPRPPQSAVDLRRAVVARDSVFALASSAPLSTEVIRQRMSQQAIDPSALFGRIRCVLDGAPSHVTAGSRFEIRAQVTNESGVRLASLRPFPVHLSYRWLRDGEVVLADGHRTGFLPALLPHTSRWITAAVDAPRQHGKFELVVTLVHEQRFWFIDIDPAASASCMVVVDDGVLRALSQSISHQEATA